jgi:uncharacterized coiled-coil protein SlyX
MSLLDVELTETKKFKKLAKLIGENNAKELIQSNTEELEKRIAKNEVSIAEQRAKVKANSKYKEHKQAMKDFHDGLKDSIAPLKAVNDVAAEVIISRKS